ncbi:MAG: hypothetical protein KBC69_02460 [Candidatus Magasanikbacteria bacterium]|nr:hypothetical protein [Candidatus Magasanikbacteria bacterium]
MLESTIEISKEIQLRSFRAEIQSLQDKLRGKDGTIVKVNIDELGLEEMQMWKKSKKIIKNFYNTVKDVDDFADIKNSEGYRLEVKRELESIFSDDPGDNLNGRHFFSNWIVNVLSTLAYSLDSINDHGNFVESKKDLAQQLETFGVL